MKNLVFYSLTALVLVGCEAAPAPAEEGLIESQEVVIRSYLSPSERPTSSEERRALGEASRDALRATAEVLNTSVTWQEADARLQALSAEEADPVRVRAFEETSASWMLQSGALDGQTSDAALDALGRYTETLVQYRNGDTPLIADALQRLKSHWEPGRLAALATAAADEAEAAVARKTECEGCSLDEISTVLADVTRANQLQHESRVVTSITDLRALAAGAQ